MFLLFLFLISTVTSSKDVYPCESEEWRYHKGYCYWPSIYHQSTVNHRNNWYGAARECRKRSADLASIHDVGENNFVFKMNRCANTWTGLVMVNHQQKTSLTGWEWFDSSMRNYNNWRTSYPHNSYYECSYIYGTKPEGKWLNNNHCGNTRNYYVCKKQAVGMVRSNSTVNFHKTQGPCKAGWFLVGEKCYMVNTTRVDYFAAMLNCQAHQSNLVTIHSSKEDGDLTRVFDECETPWIGLENVDPDKVASNNAWKWMDGSRITYYNWKDGGITADHKKQCGILQLGAKWSNTHCWELHPFVCEIRRPKK